MIFPALSIAALLLPSLVAAVGVYDRPLAFVYATKSGPGLKYNESVILDALDKVQPAITSIPAFLLNVENPSKYESIISEVQKRKITIIPAIGGPPTMEPFTSSFNKGVAKAYRNYTDYVRLETGEAFIQKYGVGDLTDMIEYCVKTLGFKHVMLNPWPEVNGTIAEFPGYNEAEASFDNVLYPDGAQSWYPGNQKRIQAIRNYRSDIQILINYESPGQEQALANLSAAEAEKDMQITLTQINGQFKSENLHWCPPLGRSYDAIKLGTWDWIAQKLSQQ